jgi:hypothetical protein
MLCAASRSMTRPTGSAASTTNAAIISAADPAITNAFKPTGTVNSSIMLGLRSASHRSHDPRYSHRSLHSKTARDVTKPADDALDRIDQQNRVRLRAAEGDATTVRSSDSYLALGMADPTFGYGYLQRLLPWAKRQFGLFGTYGQRICVVLVQTAFDDGPELGSVWPAIVHQFGKE